LGHNGVVRLVNSKPSNENLPPYQLIPNKG
jgi:hypothetical protein